MNRARRDLSGGRRVTGVPTAIQIGTPCSQLQVSDWMKSSIPATMALLGSAPESPALARLIPDERQSLEAPYATACPGDVRMLRDANVLEAAQELLKHDLHFCLREHVPLAKVDAGSQRDVLGLAIEVHGLRIDVCAWVAGAEEGR